MARAGSSRRPSGEIPSPSSQLRRGPAPERCRRGGFTLVEAVVVIAIVGIIAATVAIFIRGPVAGYVDVTRRAELTDIADTALRRLGRDLRLALPNSVRITRAGGVFYLEYLETRTGGRYRAEPDSAGKGDILDFTQSDASFDTLGPISGLPGQQPVPGDRVVIYNLGIPGADAYNGDNTSVISSVGPGDLPNEVKLTFAPKQFPLASPGERFQVITGPVSYGCDPAAGTLTRYWGYAISPTQPTSFAGAASALLASRVSACDMEYAPGTDERNSLVSIRLALTKDNETVSLYYEVHVSNAP